MVGVVEKEENHYEHGDQEGQDEGIDEIGSPPPLFPLLCFPIVIPIIFFHP
jgi:hypothetical protein